MQFAEVLTWLNNCGEHGSRPDDAFHLILNKVEYDEYAKARGKAHLEDFEFTQRLAQDSAKEYEDLFGLSAADHSDE